MTDLLAQAFAKASELPESLQDELARELLAGLVGEARWSAALADSATVIASRLKAVTDVPVLVGVGISSPEQAVEVCEVADGVVVEPALLLDRLRELLELRIQLARVPAEARGGIVERGGEPGGTERSGDTRRVDGREYFLRSTDR